MFKNTLGTKIIGATISMAMAAAAIPAMTSLASENAPQGYSNLSDSTSEQSEAQPPVTDPDEARQNLDDIVTCMMDYRLERYDELKQAVDVFAYDEWIHYGFDVYMNYSEYPVPVLNSIVDMLNEVHASALEARNRKLPQIVIDNDDVTRFTAIIVDNVNEDISLPPITIDYDDDTRFTAIIVDNVNDDFSLPEIVIDNEDNEDDELTEEIAPDYGMNLEDDIEEPSDNVQLNSRGEALSNLFDTIIEMSDFGNIYRIEIDESGRLDNYNAWVEYGFDVYYNNELFTTDEINELNEALNNEYASTIDAIDAASQAEEIAPDFVIDNQDSFTIYGEGSCN